MLELRSRFAGESEESSKQLWQFFLELLLAGSSYSHLIRWTGTNLEFKIEDPEALAELWGQHTLRKSLDIDHLNQALYHCCTKTTILSQVNEREATFRFHPNIATYITMHYSRGQSVPVAVPATTDSYKEVLVVD